MREVYQNTEEVESSSIIVYPNRRRMLGWTALSGSQRSSLSRSLLVGSFY